MPRVRRPAVPHGIPKRTQRIGFEVEKKEKKLTARSAAVLEFLLYE